MVLRRRAGATAICRLLERGHDLAGQDRETLLHALGLDEAARVELGDDAVERELFLQAAQPVDEPGGAAERHALGQDLLVRKPRQALDARLQPLRGPGAGPAHGRLLQVGLSAEVERDAVERLLERGLLGGRGVDGNAQVDVAVAGVPGVAPGPAIREHVMTERRDVHAAQADEDRQSHLADLGKRLLRRGGHAKRRVGQLVRARRDGGVLEAPVLTLVAERLALPGLEDDVERLAEPRLAFRVGDAVEVVDARKPAAADPEVEASGADVIDRRGLFGDPQRIVERQHLHGHPDAQAPVPRRDRARHHDRRREHRPCGREVHLAEPHAVEPPGFGRVHEVESLAERRGLVAAAADLELHEDPEVHGSYWLLIFMSSYDGHTVIGTRLIVWSVIFGPTPISARRSMIGANIARSIVICWILCSIASRFFASRSLAWTWARSSMSG